MLDEPMLQTRGLVKQFGATRAVDGIDLCVEGGVVYGLLGRNGAGKTTLLRLILGLLPPDGGVVRLFGRDAPPADVEARDAVAGFVEEPRFYPYLSARRNLELLVTLDTPPLPASGQISLSVDEALARVDLAGRRNDEVGNFSTGTRQRLGLAAALVRGARLLVLDEPTTGLDPAHAAAVRELLVELAGKGTTVLLSSHNMAEVAEICDRVAIMRTGRVVWDGTLPALHAAAPVPVQRLATNDDRRALTVGRQHGLEVDIDTHKSAALAPLRVRADEATCDRFVSTLASAGIAVRRLQPDVPPLEALFVSLTGPDEGGAGEVDVEATTA